MPTQSMVIRYKARRSDIWHAYWYTWRHGVRANVLRLFIFGCVFFVAEAWLHGVLATPASRLAGALAVASSAMLLLAVYPLLRFKRDERTLTISPTGLATVIGKQSGDIPWRKIARVALVGERIFVIGKSGNAFAVPREAFENDAQRNVFLQRATQWLNQAR
jgi:hypothetical protein